MLRIQFYSWDYIKKEEDAIYQAPLWFDHWYDDDWLRDPVVIQMVKDIDNSELMDKAVWSPVLGSVSFRDLSGGVKTLIVMYKVDGYKIAINHCGDNCAKWIEKIGKMKDITVLLPYIMYFSDDIEFVCVNDGVHSIGIDDYLIKAAMYL